MNKRYTIQNIDFYNEIVFSKKKKMKKKKNNLLLL